MTFIYIWFGLSAFVIVNMILQWIFDGCLVHEGEDRYYYLNGLMINCFASIPFGPFVFFLQLAQGNLLAHRRS